MHEYFLEVTKTAPGELFYTIQPLSTRAVQEGTRLGGNILGLEEVPQTCEFALIFFIFYATFTRRTLIKPERAQGGQHPEFGQIPPLTMPLYKL